MALFEHVVFLLLVAAVLLAGSRRFGVPYPTLLCVAGVGAAFLPLSSTIQMDPRLALVIFIAPALLDAAYDTAPRDILRLWVPLLALAVGAVIITAAAVAALGHYAAGIPLAAAIALGAIVAPTDAAALNAITAGVGLPRHGSLVIRGESLLNDATALLIFAAAVAGASDGLAGHGLARIVLAVPGGIVLGVILAKAYVSIAGIFSGTLSSVIMQFAGTFGVWILAEDLHLSPVLAVVAYAMFIGQVMPGRVSARDRVQSYSVWAAVVFVLNVLAFLFMGLQTRAILVALPAAEFWQAIRFASAVLVVVIAARMAVLVVYHAISTQVWRVFKPRWLPRPQSWKATLVLSWCGTRGLLTLATAFSLPPNFPRRNAIVLCAMSVVLGTLVIQGLTIKPLIRWWNVADDQVEFKAAISRARTQIIEAGLTSAAAEAPAVSAMLQKQLHEARKVATSSSDPQGPTRYDSALARAVAAQRMRLHDLRGAGEVDEDVFHQLEEELDWLELSALPSRDIEVLEV